MTSLYWPGVIDLYPATAFDSYRYRLGNFPILARTPVEKQKNKKLRTPLVRNIIIMRVI